ncbi:hypothetical protein AYL99_08935 [Fonsecaea erecta]|uniref:Extracellular membrane protein CFEM domain-containing protein n=1 Tax=Fonsecaea erecta TaxID=1367422 RepID=A0A178ZCA8_9EURO|nr:hypothetical protein AYL99_08935 [Fonsecaea erecta]OAP56823.1 hypothetical protein AYL99_08935 [Fonsecaea erecta]
MDLTAVLALFTFLFALASAGDPHDADDFCVAACKKMNGGWMASSPTCAGVTADYCETYCDCSWDGIMTCSNQGVKCSEDAVTNTCKQGLSAQWECWCQDLSMYAQGWGTGKGETCGSS